MRFDEATRPELLTALRSLLKEHEEMQQQLKDLQASHRRIAREHAALERENATLSHLQVACRLLHRSLDRNEVTTAIQEIIINLVGSEQVALFDYEARRRRLTLISSFGIDAQAWASLPLPEGPIGDCIRTGEIQVLLAEEADPLEGRPSVCVPLRIDQKVTGALVLFKLLAHKTGLEEVDFALFDLLSQQAAVALVATYPTGARPWR